MTYPVALAAEDFVPVVLTVTGVCLLGRYAGDRHRPGVLLAAALIGAGGLSKAGWKLIVALGGPDLPWLELMLFPLLTAGFGLLAWILTAHHDGSAPGWIPPLVIGLPALCAGGAVLAGSTLPLLVSTMVFATLSGVHLILAARRRGDLLAAALFGVQLLGFFVLSPLAARPDQTVALQWVEQLSNTAAQGAFAVAAFRLGRTRQEVSP
ncbi:hypothetical protein [Streptosporangium roseum]|uniref:Uncharacterized protein n=1 Tax=Streptosporangium roseum (strain ATCC 12428 / DSM 43021 / JCM 3005 / KCTC 9067 / NCIMB 10171 / NRRL 2505 / NI 9100) TaxID=479432 RepID=D2B3P1_STRRD|nr:hypothetical protein [Streptosporangium roseum]ACZ89326.1 conserved hypothetical protein [Streptosporangium roseum DSM 43021]